MSRETTFERDLHAVRDRAELGAILTRLAEQVAADLQRKGYAGRTIGIKLRFDDFRTVTRDHTLAAPTAEASAIRRAAGLCLKRVDLGRRLRLLGVRAAGLTRPGLSTGAADTGGADAPASEPELFDGID
jgi:DNA polymerase-4